MAPTEGPQPCSQNSGTQAKVAGYHPIGRASAGSPPQAESCDTRVAGTTGHQLVPLVYRADVQSVGGVSGAPSTMQHG